MGDEAERRITYLTSIPIEHRFKYLIRLSQNYQERQQSMATPARRGRPVGRTTQAAKPATRGRGPAKAPASRKQDVTEYATKPATPYHKALAKWIVSEVGYDPETAPSLRAAFLKGVSIATAARPAFMQSDFIEEWREKTGETKRGPKPKAAAEEAPVRRGRKPAPAPVEEDDDDFDDEDEVETDDVDEDDDFDDEETDSDDDDESEDDDDFDDEEEEAPKPRARSVKNNPRAASSRRAPAKAAEPARRGRPAKAAPSKPQGRKPAAQDDDDEFLF